MNCTTLLGFNQTFYCNIPCVYSHCFHLKMTHNYLFQRHQYRWARFFVPFDNTLIFTKWSSLSSLTMNVVALTLMNELLMFSFALALLLIADCINLRLFYFYWRVELRFFIYTMSKCNQFLLCFQILLQYIFQFLAMFLRLLSKIINKLVL